MDHTKEIYARLLHVIQNFRNVYTYARLSAPGFMDRHVDILNQKGNVWRTSLAHNYKVGGDVIPDPDMEAIVDFAAETAQAEAYQDTYVYRAVVDKRTSKELNEFLVLWLGNLIEQGHKSVDSSPNQ